MAEEEVEEVKKSGGGKGVIILLLIIVILLLVGVAALAFMMMSGGSDKDGSDKETPEQHASAEHGDEAALNDGIIRQYAPNFKQYEPPEPGAAPQYFAMEPFVVNFKGEGKAKFLAVTLKFMTHYPQLVADMESYRPILRNDITSLLRVQTFTVMNQDDGPDILRGKILTKARSVIEKRAIYPDLLEDVYFERFVMQ